MIETIFQEAKNFITQDTINFHTSTSYDTPLAELGKSLLGYLDPAMWSC